MQDRDAAMSEALTGSTLPHVHIFDAQGTLLSSTGLPAGGFSIGRAADSNLVLPDTSVSRHHLRISYNGGQIQVSDLGSKGGSFLAETRLPPQARQIWQPGQPLYIGPYRLELTYGDAPPSIGPVAAAAPVPAGVPVPAIAPASASLKPGLAPGQEVLALTPGQPAAVNLTVSNQGSDAEAVILSIDGLPDGWTNLPAQAIPINPGGTAMIPLLITVPYSAESLAGVYAVTIRARTLSNPLNEGTVQANWTVHLFGQSRLELAPNRAEGRREAPYLIQLSNLGNAPASYILQARDEDELLDFVIAEPEVLLDPGQTADIPLNVIAGSRLFGQASRRRFVVTADTPDEPQLAVEGQFVHTTLVPIWTIPAVLGVLLLTLLWGYNTPPIWGAVGGGALLRTPIPTTDILARTATAEQAALIQTRSSMDQTATAVQADPPLTQTSVAQTQEAEQANLNSRSTAIAQSLANASASAIVVAVTTPSTTITSSPSATIRATTSATNAPLPAATATATVATPSTTPSATAGSTTTVEPSPTIGTTMTPLIAAATIIDVEAQTLSYSSSERQLTLRARVSSAGSASLSGTVDFSLPLSGGAVGTSVAVSPDGFAETRITLPAETAAGTYSISATYSGAAGLQPTGGSGELVITPLPTTITISEPVPASLVYNQSNRSVTLAAQVSAVGDEAVVEGGDVIFTIRLSNAGVGDVISSPVNVVDGAAQVSLTVGQVNVNSDGYVVTAEYRGRGNYTGSSSNTNARLRITPGQAALALQAGDLDPAGGTATISVTATNNAGQAVPGNLTISAGCTSTTATLDNQGKASFSGCAPATDYTVGYSNPNYTAPNETVTTADLADPTLSAISPTGVFSGSATINLTLTGTNFYNDSKAYWGSEELETTRISATSLTAQVSASRLTADNDVAQEERSITVRTGRPNTAPKVSGSQTFTIYGRPQISEQPAGGETEVDIGFPLSVGISNPNMNTITYQWYVDGTAENGATSAEFTFSRSQPKDYAIYVVVKNDAGTTTSNTVTVTVEEVPGVLKIMGTGQVTYTVTNSMTTLPIAATGKVDGTTGGYAGGVFRFLLEFDGNPPNDDPHIRTDNDVLAGPPGCSTFASFVLTCPLPTQAPFSVDSLTNILQNVTFNYTVNCAGEPLLADRKIRLDILKKNESLPAKGMAYITMNLTLDCGNKPAQTQSDLLPADSSNDIWHISQHRQFPH